MDSNTLRVDAFLKMGGISGWVWKGAKYKLCIYLTCMVYFTYFNNRLPTYPKIYMFNFVIANGLRSRPLTIVFFSYCVHFRN